MNFINTYFIILTAEQFHYPPKEISLHLIVFNDIFETPLCLPPDEPDQGLLIRLIAATDVGIAVNF